MSKKRSHEEYIQELAIKNPTIEVVGKYTDALTKILHHCLIHDIYWETTPTRALNGVGCEMCRKEKFRAIRCKSEKQYIEEISKISPHINVVGKYIDARTPILHNCTIHDIEWMAYPDNMLRGCGCFKCGYEKVKDKNCKSHEQYINELKNVNPNIIVIGNYINALTPILHRCLIDGNEWYATPANILWGYGCPQCCESHGERSIRQWLTNHDIIYESQKLFENCKDIKPLPFDFYLPDYNLCIEFDGEQHYKPVEYFGGEKRFKYIVKHDNIKTQYCQNNNIKLLRIAYFENIEEKLNNFLFI